MEQTYRDIEIIVVNDGSTDGTGRIIDELASADSRIKAIFQSNKGLSEARNTGLEHASGHRVVFLDGDDCLLPDGIETLVDTARRFSAPIACASFVTDTERTANQEKNFRVLPAEKAIVNTLYQKPGFFNSAWAKIYDRSLFDGIRFRPGINYEDLDVFFLLYDKARRIAYTDRPVLHYRLNPASILHSFTPRRLDVLDVTRRIVEWTSSRSAVLQRAASDRRRSAAFNILGLILANDCAETYPDAVSECRAIIRRGRIAALTDKNIRLKNKAGILASCLGRPFLYPLLKNHYKNK